MMRTQTKKLEVNPQAVTQRLHLVLLTEVAHHCPHGSHHHCRVDVSRNVEMALLSPRTRDPKKVVGDEQTSCGDDGKQRGEVTNALVPDEGSDEVIENDDVFGQAAVVVVAVEVLEWGHRTLGILAGLELLQQNVDEKGGSRRVEGEGTTSAHLLCDGEAGTIRIENVEEVVVVEQRDCSCLQEVVVALQMVKSHDDMEHPAEVVVVVDEQQQQQQNDADPYVGDQKRPPQDNVCVVEERNSFP
jgi:hypothetical protein